MWQDIVVGIIIGIAAVAVCLYVWRKIKALKKDSSCAACDECPLAAECRKKKNIARK